MTQRRPPGVSFGTWVDRQIRDAQARGEFDNLAGAGQPIADLDGTEDELWWVKRKLAREKLSFLPPTLALRKDAETALDAAVDARTEAQARRIVEDINTRIRAAHRTPMAGPPLRLVPFDVEQVVARWRAAHPRPDPPAGPPLPAPTPRPATRAARWPFGPWRRTAGRPS